jgi:hypothetical protein
MKQTVVKLPVEIHAKVKRFCRSKHLKMGGVMCELITKWIVKETEEKDKQVEND